MLAGLLSVGSPATAQNFFLGVRINPTNAVQVNSTVTYTIGVTNFSSFDASTVFVTNALPASLQIVSVTNTLGFVTTNGTSLEWFISPLPFGFTAVMTLTVRPTVAGFFTNQITVFVPQLTSNLTLNAVSQATNPVVLADLGVLLAGPAQPAFAGDWTTYSTGVTNLGPSTATNLFVTNTLPTGAKFISASQTPTTLSSNRFYFSVTSLTNRAFKTFSVRVQLPTNSGSALFSAAVNTSGGQDTNAANNVASTNVAVLDYLSSPLALLVVTNSAQFTNRQNGLIEQKILVSNVGTAAVDSVRVILSGLTNVSLAGHTNYLFNAWGTNAGNPFVVHANTLGIGENIELLLQFSVRTRSAFPFNNSQLQAFGVSRPDLTPSASTTTSSEINYTNIALVSSGNLLLQFKSTLGKTYTIVYADNLSFSNAVIAVPSVIAPANYVQWIDYGPPGTISKPGSGSRFYRVLLNP